MTRNAAIESAARSLADDFNDVVSGQEGNTYLLESGGYIKPSGDRVDNFGNRSVMVDIYLPIMSGTREGELQWKGCQHEPYDKFDEPPASS